ncbi:MAG: DUF6259 domain-containing protein [Kiritimatiellia bacterium]
MKNRCLLFACLSAFLMIDAEVLESSSMRVAFDARGNIRAITSRDGVEFAPPHGYGIPFAVSLTDAENVTKMYETSAGDAKTVRCEAVPNGWRFSYSDFKKGLLKSAAYTVTAPPGDRRLRWNIELEPEPGRAITQYDFPRFTLVNRIGAVGGDDAFVSGCNKGGVIRDPGNPRYGAREVHTVCDQPGTLSCQFGCYYDSDALFYSACEDAEGCSKGLRIYRAPKGDFSWYWVKRGFYTEKTRLPYDVVTTCFDRGSDRPCDWYDAADYYRAWAEGQRWCRTKFLDRPDIPDWAKDAPVVTLFYRNWFDRPEALRTFFDRYWKVQFPGAPLMPVMFGWEKCQDWITPDYFPLYPTDEKFREMTALFHSNNTHAYPYPSGHFWTLKGFLQKDGTYRYDTTDWFNQEAFRHACIARTGGVWTVKAPWLGQGENACLCPGSPWSRDFWNNICAELVARGCDIIQADQEHGGEVPPCWSREHGHPPGEGDWKTAVMREQWTTQLEAMRKAGCDRPLLSCEEPNEHFNDLFSVMDYRNCRFHVPGGEWEWASVYNYVYHEYVATYQTRLAQPNRFWAAHSAADGQIPWLEIYPDDVSEAALKSPKPYFEFLHNWIRLYRGAGRPFLAHGRHLRPPRVSCTRVKYDHPREWLWQCDAHGWMPTVFAGAFSSRDGRTAYVFANATDERQPFSYRENGSWVADVLPANGIKLVVQNGERQLSCLR